MGMDCIPNAPVEPFHANWFAWGLLDTALQLSGCDTSEMAGSNDGDEVPGLVAFGWSNALKASLEKNEIAVVTVKDPRYSGGERPSLVPAGEPGSVPLDDDLRGFLQRFAEFCEQSDGFRQY